MFSAFDVFPEVVRPDYVVIPKEHQIDDFALDFEVNRISGSKLSIPSAV